MNNSCACGCGETFEPRRPWQKFVAGHRHRAFNHNHPVVRISKASLRRRELRKMARNNALLPLSARLLNPDRRIPLPSTWSECMRLLARESPELILRLVGAVKDDQKKRIEKNA